MILGSKCHFERPFANPNNNINSFFEEWELKSSTAAIAFFVPAGIGVQELAFVAIGSYVGLSPSVSFSIAIGRRVREFLVGVPAIVAWLGIFGKHLKS